MRLLRLFYSFARVGPCFIEAQTLRLGGDSFVSFLFRLLVEQLAQVEGWLSFYEEGKGEYKYMGKLTTGDEYSVYDSMGALTPYGRNVMRRFEVRGAST